MPLITWNDALSVKVVEIDAQHRRLVELVNQLHEAMSQGKGREVMGQVLAGLLEYTRTHFTSEERIMIAEAYPGYQQQKAAHEALLQQVVDLRTKFLEGEAVMTMEVMKFLKAWLTDHMQGMDARFGVYLNSRTTTAAT
jgi:hemerythrin-like metal-binding protein